MAAYPAWVEKFRHLMTDCDAIVLPVADMPAPEHGTTIERRISKGISSYNFVANLTNTCPSGTAPVLKTATGLPVGVGVVGEPFAEDKVLRILYELETSSEGPCARLSEAEEVVCNPRREVGGRKAERCVLPFGVESPTARGHAKGESEIKQAARLRWGAVDRGYGVGECTRFCRVSCTCQSRDDEPADQPPNVPSHKVNFQRGKPMILIVG